MGKQTQEVRVENMNNKRINSENEQLPRRDSAYATLIFSKYKKNIYY